MDGALSKVFSIILIVILVFGYTISNQTWLIERKIYNHVNTVTYQFEKQVRNKGYIDKADYENFLKDLYKTGRYYNVQLLHTKILYYPLTPLSPGYTTEKPYSEQDFQYGNSTILNKLYDKNKPEDYIMSVGDNFKVTVIDDEVSGIRVFTGFGSHSEVIASYGGAIDNESN